MESQKLDISGKSNEDAHPTAASYKQIPEEDIEDQALIRSKNVVKSNNTTPEADGAHEKMLPEEESKIAPNSKLSAGDVKFTFNEKQNGDAKLDIGDLKSTFVGMGKEELMKYANDPFWVRLRWILFILFWLAWAGMLVGAILIIIAAPKCDPPTPKTWWEEGPLTEVKFDTVNVEDLKRLKESGVKGIIADWPLDTYQTVASSAEFVEFLKSATEANIDVIVELEPGYSNIFFNDSEAKDDTYINYYIWNDPKNENGGETIPPNNWVSTSDKSSWVYSPLRKQYYLAPFNVPQLNFRDEKVQGAFVTVLNKFLEAGVKGFRLRNVPYLLVDKTFQNETIRTDGNNLGATYGQYNFYSHDKTMNSKDLGPLLKSWRTIIQNKTTSGVLFLTDDVIDLEPYQVNKTVVIDLPGNSRVFNKAITSGLQLMNDIKATFELFKNEWPLWEHRDRDSGLDRDVIDIVTFMLRGATLIPYNHTVNKELLNYRSSASVMFGDLIQYAVANETAYAFIRVTPGNPGFVVALNPTDQRIVVDFPTETKGVVTDDVTVQFYSSNYNETNVETKIKIKANAVPISAKSSVILTYVPKSVD